MTQRAAHSVSIYLPLTDVGHQQHTDRTNMSRLADSAVTTLRSGGADAAAVTAVEETLRDLVEDDDFWSRQADTLAVFATPEKVWTFRLPNRLSEAVGVSDRFYVKPLMRALTFPHAAYVLALSKGTVRLLEIGAEGQPQEVAVPDLPRDAWDPRGNKVFKAREATFVRQIDHALRGVLNGSDLPLIIAATEGVNALFRTVNTYPGLLEKRLPGNPEETSDADLAAEARQILDELYVKELTDLAALFEVRSSQGRVVTDISDAARMATMGAVDTVVVDIDASVPGTVDEMTGAVTFAQDATPQTYGVVDEILRRVHAANGRVLAVRSEEVPGGGPVAAILRFKI